MSKYKKLAEEYNKIYSFVSSTYDEAPHSIMDRMSMLNIYLARTGRMVAEADFLKDEKTQEVLSNIKLLGFSPSIQKEWIKSSTKAENMLFKSVERLNAAIVHQLDVLRSQLSYLKTEIENIR